MSHKLTSFFGWGGLFVLLALLAGCKKQADPVTPTIPICHAESTDPGSSTIIWTGLPIIPTTQPVFKETEKVYRTNFATGTYSDSLSVKTYQFTVVANASDNLHFPTDLDLNPLRPNELWITNYGEAYKNGQYSNKAYTITVFNPGSNAQFAVQRKDKEKFTRHFFSYPTSLAFNKDGYWANSSFFNNNGNNGPTLWTSDFSIYADSIKYTLNGSHNSMLHESFTSLGIAADETNTFWTLDGTTGDVVSYNFGKGHYPGGDDHTDGTIRRYSLPNTIKPVDGLPSHVCYNTQTGDLYVVDALRRQIVRLNTRNGTISRTKQGIDNPKEYSIMTAQSDVLVNNLPLRMPCGIDTDGNRLYISDYETGRIAVLELKTGQVLSTIETKSRGIMGLYIDKAGHLWYVNQLTNELVKIDL